MRTTNVRVIRLAASIAESGMQRPDVRPSAVCPSVFSDVFYLTVS